MVEVTGLTKRYGRHLALAGVSFRVARGEVVGFLGPNGAGKSTTMRIVAGFLGMTAGSVCVMGSDIVADPVCARGAIGYMPETVPLYPEMRVAEYLAFRASLKGAPREKRSALVEAAMSRTNIIDSANRTIGQLSKGYRQRVGLADAIVANPPVLLLDEPTAGLDPNQIRETRSLIRDLGRDHAVLLSTHLLREAEATCDRIIVIADGKVVLEGATDAIGRASRVSSVSLVVRGDALLAHQLIASTFGDAVTVVRAKESDSPVHRFRIEVPASVAAVELSTAIESLVATLLRADIHVREVAPTRTSLEQIFADLTRSPGAPEGDA